MPVGARSVPIPAQVRCPSGGPHTKLIYSLRTKKHDGVTCSPEHHFHACVTPAHAGTETDLSVEGGPRSGRPHAVPASLRVPLPRPERDVAYQPPASQLRTLFMRIRASPHLPTPVDRKSNTSFSGLPAADSRRQKGGSEGSLSVIEHRMSAPRGASAKKSAHRRPMTVVTVGAASGFPPFGTNPLSAENVPMMDPPISASNTGNTRRLNASSACLLGSPE